MDGHRVVGASVPTTYRTPPIGRLTVSGQRRVTIPLATGPRRDRQGYAGRTMTSKLLGPLQGAAARQLAKLVGSERFAEEQYGYPLGDPGLFGPNSVTWKVHEDLSMFVGGVSALMLQALHPLALAGVLDHSDYRTDPLRRLARTSSFIGVTTFAASPVAEQVIDIVKAVHRGVVGVAPDGRAYSAGDPDLLRWIHVAEVRSFLEAHRRYHPNPIRGRDIDRYYAENVVVAERLGATEVPASATAVETYLESVQPELECGPRAREAMAFLCSPWAPDPVTKVVSAVIAQAAIEALPGWARSMYGIARFGLVESAIVRPTTWGLLGASRALIGPSPILAQARERCRQTPPETAEKTSHRSAA